MPDRDGGGETAAGADGALGGVGPRPTADGPCNATSEAPQTAHLSAPTDKASPQLGQRCVCSVIGPPLSFRPRSTGRKYDTGRGAGRGPGPRPAPADAATRCRW